MVLGIKELHNLVKEKKLVENLSERELTNPEGAGFDFRLGKVHEISGEAYLGIDARKTTEIDTVLEYNDKEVQIFTLQPGAQVLVTTLERVNLPKNLTANFWARGTLYRNGIILSGGNVAPGYEGELSFTLFNSSKCAMKIEMGARIIHVQFFEVQGEGNAYRGQWKGGRINVTTLEKQV